MKHTARKRISEKIRKKLLATRLFSGRTVSSYYYYTFGESGYDTGNGFCSENVQ